MLGVTVSELGDQYCLLGPYSEACVRTEVEILEPSNSGQARFAHSHYGLMFNSCTQIDAV